MPKDVGDVVVSLGSIILKLSGLGDNLEQNAANIIKIIIAFLLIMFGKHTIMKSMISVIEGHNISVKLDRKATLQIDGETIPEISEYTIMSAKEKMKV